MPYNEHSAQTRELSLLSQERFLVQHTWQQCHYQLFFPEKPILCLCCYYTCSSPFLKFIIHPWYPVFLVFHMWIFTIVLSSLFLFSNKKIPFGSQSSFYVAPTLTWLHYFNRKFPMKNPSSIKTNVPKTKIFLTLQFCSPSSITITLTIDGITIPEWSTLTFQDLWLFPFLYSISISIISSSKMLPSFLLPPFLFSQFYINSILSLSVSKFPFQNHSIYFQTT